MPFVYQKDPHAIEAESLGLIRSVLDAYALDPQIRPVAERVVHAGADFSLASLVQASPDGVRAGTAALRRGGSLYCDVEMVRSGLSRPLVERFGLLPRSSIHDPEVHRRSEEEQVTRAMASVDLAVAQGVRLYAFGNAPTALFRLLEHVREGAPVDFVCAFPVGFVGAAESKRALLASRIPCVALMGPRGGSNLCAAACNALLRLAAEEEVPSRTE